MTTRLRDALLWTTVVIGLAGAAAALGTKEIPGEGGDEWTLGIIAIGFSALGWFVASRRPALPIGWLMLAGGAIQSLSFLTSWWAGHSLITDPGSLRLGTVAAWLSLWLAPLPLPLVLVAPLVLFPDGRARSRAWRWFLLAVSAVVGVLVVVAAVISIPVAVDHAIELTDRPDITGGPTAERAIKLAGAAWVVAVFGWFVALGGVLVARHRTVGLPRRQHTTVLLGTLVTIATPIVDWAIGAASDDRFGLPRALGTLGFLALPVAITLAVVRYRLFDLGVLISRSTLVVLIGAMLAALYTIVLIVVTAVLDDSTVITVPTVLAAGAVVFATAPVVTWATRTTRRWFGRSGDSTSVAARFSEPPADEGDARAVVERLASIVRDELRLGSIEIAADGLEPVVAGRPEGPTFMMPLDYQGRRVGRVVVTARPGERLAEPDHRALERIAHYLAVTTEAIRVSDDLRVTQQALRNAYAEERRRVRLDLHDGIGPTLATVRLKLVAHRRALPAELSVDDIVDQVSDAIREIRRIVEGLQPSLLEDLGLVPALQILIADTRRTSGIDIMIDAAPELPDIPAHIAVTSYRVIAEGLANVIRHSRATTCTVHLAHPDRTLQIDIHDDGCGFDPAIAKGMGLRSIATRVTAAGGQSRVTSRAGTGTTISLELPT